MPATTWVAPLPEQTQPLPAVMYWEGVTPNDGYNLQDLLDKINELTVSVQQLTAANVELRSVIDALP